MSLAGILRTILRRKRATEPDGEQFVLVGPSSGGVPQILGPFPNLSAAVTAAGYLSDWYASHYTVAPLLKTPWSSVSRRPAA